MGRPLRIDHPGAYHHVTNRGRNKQDVFGDDEDRELFLGHLQRVIDLGYVDLHAFVLMDNHYHLLLRSLAADGLSRAMQFLGSRYTQDINEKYRFDGALFKGRFYSKLIDSEGYLVESMRYIPNNPVKAGLVRRPEEHRWSSHPAILGIPGAVDVSLSSDLLTGYFDGDPLAFDWFVRARDTERAARFEQVIQAELLEQSLAFPGSRRTPTRTQRSARFLPRGYDSHTALRRATPCHDLSSSVPGPVLMGVRPR